jgi:hypothetical protein
MIDKGYIDIYRKVSDLSKEFLLHLDGTNKEGHNIVSGT